MKKLILIFLVAILTGACANRQAHPTLVITNDVLNPVNDHLFGHFMEKCSWGGEIGGDLVINPNTGTFDPLVLDQLKAMQIPNLRYPGGSDVDYYNWTEMIDHAPGQTERKPYRQYRQGQEGKVVSDNRLGMNEFLTLCEILDAEPILVLNIGDAFHKNQSIKEAKASAAALYAYCNLSSESGNEWANYRLLNGRKKPFKVNYFEIGNEYLGFEGFGWNQDFHIEEPIRHLYKCIEAVADTLLAMDPDVKIIVDGPLPELNKLFETKMKEKIAYLVFHTYVPWGINQIFTGDSTAVNLETISAEQVWNAWVATPGIDPVTGLSVIRSGSYQSSALNTGFQIAVTEWNWNGWFGEDPLKAGLPKSDLAKGVGAAGFLHAMMRMGGRLEMACQSMTVGKGWGITGIRVDPTYRQESVLLPSFQVTGLYSKYHGNSLLKTTYLNIPSYKQSLRMSSITPHEKVACLDMLTTRSENQLFIHVINRSYGDSYSIKVDMKGLETEQSFVQHTLTGNKTSEISNESLEQSAEIVTTEFKYPGKPIIIEVPESSVSVFVFNLKL